MMLDWLIIGGGIHGVHIAARLIGEAGVDSTRLRIVDPGARLLERWRACTKTTGMKHLRSPSVHHLDLDPWSLQRFAGHRRNRKRGLFAWPYDRPALALFDAHCDRIIEHFGLAKLHLRARAERCIVACDGVTVDLSNQHGLRAQNIVLAIGASEQPEWPAWAPRDDPRVQHVFHTDFDGMPSETQSVVVVGGGISAVQVALRCLAEGHRVQLVARHALRERQFDSDPGWLGPKFMAKFSREQRLDRRRALIAEARYRGSVPPDLHNELRRAIRHERMTWHHAKVEELELHDLEVTLRLSSGSAVRANRVLLATGFSSHRPGGAWIDQLVKSAELPCAKCGYPIVDPFLRWHPRVFVSGPLAELEIGPASRNISGARRAGDRIVAAARAASAYPMQRTNVNEQGEMVHR